MKHLHQLTVKLLLSLTFLLLLTSTCEAQTETESNNDFSSANPIAVNTEATGSVCPGDEDFFKTVLPKDGKYRIYFEATNAGSGYGYLNFSGYDERQENGNLINQYAAYSIAAGTTSLDSVDLYCRAGGDTFYFRFRDASQCFSYKLSYKLLSTPPASQFDAEPNNTFTQAVPFNMGDTAEGYMGYVAAGGIADQNDFFKTVLPKDGKYRIYYEATNAGSGYGYLGFSGYDQRREDGNLINQYAAYSIAPGATSVDSVDLYCRAAGDTFYFRFKDANQCFSYKLRYQLLSTPPASQYDAEPNNTFTQAVPFNMGDTAQGYMGYVAAGGIADQNDFFKTVLPKDGKYRIYFSATNAGSGYGYLGFSGYDQRQENGNLMNQYAANSIAPGATSVDSVDLYCREAGDTLYFRFRDANQCFSYTLSYQLLSTPPASQFDAEPNNTFTQAVPFNIDDTAQGYMGYVSAGGIADQNDFFKTVLPKDGRYRVYFEATNAGSGYGYLNIAGYDQRKDDGRLFGAYAANSIAPGATALDSVELYSRAAGDTFYLRFHDANECFSYKLTYKLISTPAIVENDVEPNNTFGEATAFNITDTMHGHIGYVAGGAVTDQNDFYKTVLPKDGRYRIYYQATNSGSGYGYLSIDGYDQRKDDGRLYGNYAANSIAPGAVSMDSVDLYCRGAGDTIYFRLNSPSQSFSYKISYKLVGSAPSDPEFNNSFTEAITFNEKATVTGNVGHQTGGVNDTYDYYKTVLPKNGTLRIFTEATNTGSGNGYLVLEGYDSQQNSVTNYYIANSTAPGSTTSNVVNLYCRTAGTFYFRISQSSSCFNYKLRYEISLGADTTVYTCAGCTSDISKLYDVSPFSSVKYEDMANPGPSVNPESVTGGTYMLSVINGSSECTRDTAIITVSTGQIVTFDSISDKVFGDAPFVVSAKSSAGLPVTYKILSGPASINKDTVTVTGVGSVTIRAEQPGDETYNHALADRTFNVRKGNASITLTDLTKVYTGNATTPGTVTDPPSLPVAFTFNGSADAPVNAGSYLVAASINSTEYSGSVSDTFVIQKANQTVTITPVPDKEFAKTPFDVTATASSGLPVTFSISTSPAGIASISGNTITMKGLGTVIISAAQNGNTNYNAAEAVADTFVINKGNQVITLDNVPDHVIGDTIILHATASSDLPVTYSIASTPSVGVAKLSNDTLILNGTTGTVTVNAAQDGNGNYNKAEVQQSFKVSGKLQTITFDTIPKKIYGETPPFDITAIASSGLPVTFRIVSGPAVISQNTITLTGDGTVVVEASQQGSGTYAEAPAVQQSFIVTRRYPDFIVQNVTSTNTEVAPGDTATVRWTVGNVGDQSSLINWTERIYLQSSTGENRTVIKQVSYTNPDSLTIGKTISRSELLTIPAQLNMGDEAVFVVEVVPGVIKEAPGAQANNVGVQPDSFIVKKILSLELVTGQVNEGSNDGIIANVSRTGSITNPLTVNVSLKNAARFSFPSTVTIPAGQAAQNITITAVNNNAIEGTIVDSLAVAATNFTGALAAISILDNDKPTLTITQMPVNVMEGEAVTFKVNTDLTLTQPLQVYLTSNNQIRFPVPAAVTIPAGSHSVDVTVTLEQDQIPEIDVPVTIIAGAANHISANATIEVKDEDIPGLELIVETNMISESAGYYATKATLRRKANSNPIAFSANLSTGSVNTLILPAGISLAKDENEKTFNIGVVDNSLADGDRKVAITASIFVNSCGCSASSASSGSVSTVITVTDNDGPALSLTANPLTLAEGLSNAGALRITRNAVSTNALTVGLSSSDTTEVTVPATAIIPAGQTFVDVPVTTVNDGISDGNQQVYIQSSASGFSAGSVWVIVSDQNKPDLQIPVVKVADNNVQSMSVFNYQFAVKNTGFATAPPGVVVRGYLSLDNVVDKSDSLISEDVLSEGIAAGQTKQIINAVKIPNLPGQYKLLYVVNPDLLLTELLTTNNTSASTDITIKPDYTATALVDKAYYLRGTTIPVTGSATRNDGSAAANEKVEVYVIVNGLRRTISATTDAAGNYTSQFVPLANEAGHYSVGAAYPGLGATAEQDNFDIPGVRVNDGNVPQFKLTLKETMTGTLPVFNMSNTSLTNFSLVPVSLPNGATIRFDTVPVFAGNATINLGYTVSGSVLSPGNNFEIANFKASAQEGNLQGVNVYYFCQAPNAYVEASISTINVSTSASVGERLVEFTLINKGKGATGDVAIDLPEINWLNTVTPRKLPSLAPGDTAVVVLKFLALAEVPFDYPIKGDIAINTQNGNSFTIPFTFQKVSQSSGTVKITATDQFTYYATSAPKVKGGHVVIKNYYTGQVYVDGFTDSSGVLTATGIPEGTHRIVVDKDQHQPYNGTLTVNPGQTLESTVFLNYQAITFNWSVVPTAIQDEYDITLETKFETNVPVPVVTIDMPKRMPQLSGTETYAFNAVLTNHGLITAKEVKLGLPTADPEYEFVTNYVPADLAAQQSIEVPVIMRRRTQPPTGGRASVAAISQYLGMEHAAYRSAESAGGNCQDFTSVSYWYTCNFATGLWEKGGTLFSYDGRSCTGGNNPVYTGIPVDVGGIPTSDDGGYNDVPCATCGPGGKIAIPNPFPPSENEKKSCVQCINDIAGALNACTGVGGPVAGVLSCVSGNMMDNKEWYEYGACIPLPIPPPISCLMAVNGAMGTCAATSGAGGERSSRVAGTSILGAAFDKIGENLQLVEDAYKVRENWSKEYFGNMIFSDAFNHLSALIETRVMTLDTISKEAQDSIIAGMSGYEIEVSTINAFFSRWNTSILARKEGVMQPNEKYPDIINWTKVKVYSDYLINAQQQSVDKGFTSVSDMYEKEHTALKELVDQQKNAVCASVKMQLSQRLTMTREAFEGTLEIFNGHPTDKMDSLSVNIKITDENGVPANGLFEIQTKGLTNIADITGTGAIASQQKAGIKFLFIPENGAAPTAPKVYNFGGSVTYWDPYANGMVTMPLSSVPLTVNPSPNLMLHYFMERNILGDDPLTTPDIEPTIPAELAVMVENQGYGSAVNMMISSAQPKITENEKGLAINFNLIGSNFQGQPKKLGVTDINFGTIPALQTRIGQWYFTSSLLGKFVSYDAKVVHSNSFGNPELSLVKGVKLHELTKSIKAYGSLDDGINDFLVNDIFDTHDVPDVIYFSQGNRTAKVYEAATGSFSSPVTPPSFTNTLTVTAAATGWNYIKLDDPGKKLYEIASVTRNDGQVIPLDNAWLTFVTLPVNQAPKYENKFHFIDTFATVEPVSYTVVWKSKSTDVPKVDTITGVPKQVTSTQVQNVQVVFNRKIDPTTFNYEDLTLTLQGGQNIMNNSVVITQTDTATFNVDLSNLTAANGFYAFTVQAANVANVYGINGQTGKQVTWTQFLNVPVVQAFEGIPGNHIAMSYDKLQVLFNLPIDAATVTPARFIIKKNNQVVSGSVTVDSVRTDHKLFYLSGLKDILTASGDYELTVDLPNIKSENQVAGVEPQSVVLTVDNTAPIVLNLQKSKAGALDPQHVPYVNIKFDEDVVGFNTAFIKLTRNGEVVSLRIEQLSNTDLKTWMAGNFGMLTYPDGAYTLTVDMTGVKDAIGNTGTGTRQLSWVVDRTSVVEITNLGISPDRGYSDKDGITSEQSLNVNFTLGRNAAQVAVYQVDLGGQTLLATVNNVTAGEVSIPVVLASGGNTGIRVSVTGASGGVGSAEKTLFVDQVALTGKWNFAQNQTVTRQPDTIQLSLSSKLLSDAGFVDGIQLRKNGAVQPSVGLSYRAINDTLYEVSGLRNVSIDRGSYELAFNLQQFVKYNSGKGAAVPIIVSWNLLSTHHAPITKAGNDTTITVPGTVTLNGSASTDPDSDPVTYRWVAPEGIVLKDSTTATPSFDVTAAQQGNNYSFLLIVSDGLSFTTDVVNVAVNISNQEYYRSIITGNWNDPATWQSSPDSMNWTAATVSPNNNSKTITIQPGHTVTVSKDVTIDETFVQPGGTLSVTAGNTLTVINNGLTLRSNADSTASIGPSAGNIVGNVTVERYIPARRAWRLLTVPFTNSQTVNAAWQEGGVTIPGYGTHITGPAITKGFDASPGSSSSIMYFSQPTNTFEPLSSTLSPLTNLPGYFLFVRGDRTVNLAQGSSAPATNTVLRATGTLKTGNQPAVPVAATGFTLIGNPYASAIDFSKITKTNVPDRFFVWDPKRAATGAYVLFDADNGYAPLNSGGSYTGPNSLIQSGQAFFVEGNGTAAGSIGIAEDSKSNGQRNSFRSNDGQDEKLLINLKAVNADNSLTLVDGAQARYNNAYSNAVTLEDAGKPDNVDENIAIVRNNKHLTVEKRPLIDAADTVFLKIYNMKVKNYEYEIVPTHFTTSVSAYLEDLYLGTSKPIALETPTTVRFSITTDVASADPARFRIVFKSSGALPGNITKVKAYQKDAGIQVDWDVATEANIKSYELEKSGDGVHFGKETVVTAAGDNSGKSYSWFDNKPFYGDNFYRIKITDNSGEVKYTEVVNVKTVDGKSSIVVYPNPVSNKVIFVQLTNQPKGNYSVQLYNNLGQQLMNTMISHEGGSATKRIPLHSIVSKGAYRLHITNGESKLTQQVVVE